MTGVAPLDALASFDPLAALRRVPGVTGVLDTLTTIDIVPVTDLLESAAYLPVALDPNLSSGAGVEEAGRRLHIATRDLAGSFRAANRLEGAVARGRLRLHPTPEDAVVVPDQPAPAVPFDPHRSQRLVVTVDELRFPGTRTATGYRAFGAGRTYPSRSSDRVPFAVVLDLTDTSGQLSGLMGTVSLSGSLNRNGTVLESVSLARVMDPNGGLLTQCPLPTSSSALGVLPREPHPSGQDLAGVTYLAFLGQVDPDHPVTLRVSLTEGILGSNVFELLRPATLDCAVGADGRLLSHSATGPVAGSVAARLSFNPLSLCVPSGVQTRDGVFVFHDCTGRETGRIYADMVDGRAFRTFVGGRLLPFFRFGGSGPITRGTGVFAGARGVMMLNAVISVQPRTLSNLYVFRLEDPDGRFRAPASHGPGGEGLP